MLILNGKYNTAKVFTDNVDSQTIGQIITMCNEKITENSQVRIMPDTHFGKGATIGTSILLPEDRSSWKIGPSVVGVDLSCGMMSYKIKNHDIDLSKLDEVVNSFIPAGENVNSKALDSKLVDRLIKQLSFTISNENRHFLGLGSLGGGNHFIELAVDENGDYWLTVHSGSRSFGANVARHHEKIAKEYHDSNRGEIDRLIIDLTQQGRQREIQDAIKSFKSQNVKPLIPYLEGELLEAYLNDIFLAEQFAIRSRQLMLDRIVNEMNWTVVDDFDSIHNNIDIENGVIRKGATSARKNERLIIPLNMRDGSLICVGKGNSDWNYSAPHGAGRIMSRSQAKREIDIDEYRKQMSGIYTSSVGESTLDEAPNVYKPADEIISLIGDTVDILHHVKPVYNFKAH